MKKLFSLFFAAAMLFSVVFISEAISSNNPFSAQAQVRVRRRGNGSIASRTYRGGKYVAHKTVRGTKYVAHKTKRGTKYTVKKTTQGTRYTSHKVKRGTKSVFSKTKKVVVGQ